MNQKLQQAIAAARSGDNKKAQYLLTQTLQENPEETQAWYLLSLLVDSEEKQIAYLNRVLAIDPAHEKAQERLAALTAVSPTHSASPDDLDLVDQEDSNLLPAWMAADPPEPAVESAAKIEDLLETGPELAEEELPDWLQDSVVDEWAMAEEETTAPVQVEEPLELVEIFAEETPKEPSDVVVKPAKTKKTASDKQKEPTVQQKKSGAGLSTVLAVLVILAILVGAFLIYLIVTM